DRPSISNLQNLTVSEDTNAVVVNFTIDDPESLPQDLTVSVTSTNLALVPTNNLTLGGSGANRTLTIVPVTNRFGTTLISVFVSDGFLTATDTFVLTVTAVNDAPTITGIANQTILEDTTTGPLSFTIDDVESAETNLNLSATSSNPTLIPLANINFGGTGANRTVTVRPATNQFGPGTITVTVSDGALSNSVSFAVNVIPVNDPPTINPIGNLTIGEDSAQQTVNFNGVNSGAANEAQTLTVTARSSNPSLIPDPLVTYTSPQTNGTLRLTPAGNSSGSATITVTVRDDGTSNNVVVRTFTVTVNAVNDPPTISTIPNITTGEDTPVSADITIGDIETPVSALTLSGTCTNATLLASSNITFHGSGALRTMVLVPSPNQFGTSTVTVAVSDGTASVSNSFTFAVIATNDAPTLDPIRDVFLNQSAGVTTITLTGISSGAANETQNLTFSNSFTGGSGFYFSGGTPSISYTNPNSTATLSFRVANNQTGTSMVTVVVRETNATINALTSRSFTIYVKPTANTAPTISTITNRTTLEDTPIAIPFVINDAQTPANLLTVNAFTANLALLPPSSFAFSGTGTNRTLTITPATNQSGSATVTVSVMDTNFGGVSTNFVLTVTAANDLPVISGIASQTIQRNSSTAALPFTVGDVETAAGTLTLSATSSSPTLVPVANVVFGGSGTNRAVTVTPATGQAGTATITVTVRDANAGTASTTFDVTVLNPSPTPLAITRSGGTVTLSWSASAGNFVLQSCSAIATTWTDVSDTPVLSGGTYRVNQAIDSDVRLYRLRVP
ncbi:MAG TPA: Ig-like domain-containing protein, partial [Candidatus Binatia bacterium]|nr:Ig-like domain-containing protein [Candidatus Binatia bacterium]